MKAQLIKLIAKNVHTFKAPRKKAKKLSGKAAKVSEFISDGNPFGCNTRAVHGLMEIILGEKLSTTAKYSDGTALRIVGNESSHRFNADDIVIRVSRETELEEPNTFYVSDGTETEDDDFNFVNYKDVVPATAAEMKAFIKSLNDLKSSVLMTFVEVLVGENAID